MQIEKMDISRLNPAEYNPRKDLKSGDVEYEKLKRSMEQFGYVEPVVWNKSTGKVISGHQRLKVLVDTGQKEVDCVVVEMDEEREKALNIALNKINGEWDNDKLAMLISDLQGSDFDVSLTGFEEDEIADLFEKVGEKDIEDDGFDMTSALEKASFVERGDIWTVGRHRLICGDATNGEDVKTLMDGKRANLIITDPPYGVSFKSTIGLTIKNDTLKNEEFYKFLLSSFKCMAEHLEKGGSAYIFHADTEGLTFRKAFIEAGFHLANVCIWVKNSMVLGRSDYQWQHEPILYGFLQNGKHSWYAGRNQTTIWRFDRPNRNTIHPNPKPLDLISYPICNSSQENAIILDTFGGSGSTMMACEKTNRICYMMEIDEKYASVILRRAVENGISPDDIYVIRDGVRIPYSDLVKKVEVPTV